KSVGRQVLGIGCKQSSFLVVETGGHNMPLGFECGQNFFRVLLVVKGQGGCTVGGDDFSQGGEFPDRGLPKRQKLVGKKCRARQQQHRPAGQQNNRHQLPLDRRVFEWHRLILSWSDNLGRPEQLGTEHQVGV